MKKRKGKRPGPRSVKKRRDKVFNYPIGLRGEQIDWIDNHPNFRPSKFVRDQLDKYIKLKTEVEQIATIN